MTSDRTFQLATRDPATLLEQMATLCERIGPDRDLRLYLALSAGGGEDATGLGKDMPTSKLVVEKAKRLRNCQLMSVSMIQIEARDRNRGDLKIQLRRDGWKILLFLETVPDPWAATEAVSQIFKTFDPSTVDDADAVTRDRESSIELLRVEIANLAKLQGELTAKNIQDLIGARAALDEEASNRRKALETEFDGKFQELKKERDAFVAEKAEFDSRSATYARRDLGEKLKEMLDKMPDQGVPDEISGLRSPITWTCFSIMGLASVGAVIFAIMIANRGGVQHWIEASPFASCLALLGTTLFFYVKWQNWWFKRLADANFSSRKSKIDYARASWLTELLFEWKDKKEIGVPEEVLAAFTADLFTADQAKETPLHPLDSVLSVVRRAEKMEIGNLKYSAPRRPAKDKST